MVILEVDEALKAPGRGFLGSDNNKIKDKRFHLMTLYVSYIIHSIRLTVLLIFLLKPLINNLYVMF